MKDKRPSDTSSNHSGDSLSESKADKIKNTLKRSASDSDINVITNKINNKSRSRGNTI